MSPFRGTAQSHRNYQFSWPSCENPGSIFSLFRNQIPVEFSNRFNLSSMDWKVENFLSHFRRNISSRRNKGNHLTISGASITVCPIYVCLILKFQLFVHLKLVLRYQPRLYQVVWFRVEERRMISIYKALFQENLQS